MAELVERGSRVRGIGSLGPGRVKLMTLQIYACHFLVRALAGLVGLVSGCD